MFHMAKRQTPIQIFQKDLKIITAKKKGLPLISILNLNWELQNHAIVQNYMELVCLIADKLGRIILIIQNNKNTSQAVGRI